MKKNSCFLLSLLCFIFSFNISYGGPLAVTLTPTNISCFGGRNGAVSSSASGGTAPYTYLWSNGATSAGILGLAAGYYKLTVTDGASATVTADVTLTEPTQLILHLTPSIYSPQNSNISCYSCCNAYINISTGGGVTAYSYLWSSGQTTANISNLCKNNYIVTVTDAHGCTITDQLAMSEPDKDSWGMTGSSNTNPPTQFIGTTDNKDFVFKSNNSEALRIKANGNLTINSFSGGIGSKLLLSDSLGNIFSRQIILPSCTTNPLVFAWTQSQFYWADVYSCYRRIGIGTDQPLSSLEVKGDVRITNYLNSPDYIRIMQDGSGTGTGNSRFDNFGSGDLLINYDTYNNNLAHNLKNVLICTGNSGWIETGGNTYLATNSGKKVGVNISSSTTLNEQLEVNGTAKVTDLKVTNLIGNKLVYADANGLLHSSSVNVMASAAWEAQGNSINSGDFIGTSNNNDLVFKANNNERMSISKDDYVSISNNSSLDNGAHLYLGHLATSNGDLKWPSSYIGFNAYRNNNTSSNTPWTLRNSGSNSANGGSLIWGSIDGAIYFSSTPNNSASTSDQLKSDVDMLTNVKFKISPYGNIGIGTIIPVEKFQIGDRWTFSDGGTKIIGNNFHYNGTAAERIVDGYSSTIEMDATGNLSFKTAGNGTQGTTITYNEGLQINKDGQIVMGPFSSLDQDYRLTVCGNIKAGKVRIESSWCDYVFERDYRKMSLPQLDQYIKNNKHLPDIPTTKEIETAGLDIGSIIKKEMEKIEELTLYTIEEDKKILEQDIKIENLQKIIEIMKKDK